MAKLTVKKLDAALEYLRDGEPHTVVDAVAAAGGTALAGAWASGWVEFGRVPHCQTGNLDHNYQATTLIIESDKVSVWCGKKTPQHGSFAGILADANNPPTRARYQKYVLTPDPQTGDLGNERVAISEAEAHEALAMHVRLTDEGSRELSKQVQSLEDAAELAIA